MMRLLVQAITRVVLPATASHIARQTFKNVILHAIKTVGAIAVTEITERLIESFADHVVEKARDTIDQYQADRTRSVFQPPEVTESQNVLQSTIEIVSALRQMPLQSIHQWIAERSATNVGPTISNPILPFIADELFTGSRVIGADPGNSYLIHNPYNELRKRVDRLSATDKDKGQAVSMPVDKMARFF